MAKLEIKQVSKTIGKQQLLAELDLTCEAGQIVALCGGNGAGKSTLLTMIAGLHKPSSGSISIDQLTAHQQREQYVEKIGYMPDDYHFANGFTAFEMLSFWGDLKGVERARAREVLEQVGLHETGKKKVQSFSKGMRQRLLLAQALLSKPEVLLLDEPTNGLDPYWMKRLALILQQEAARGCLVVFSTHQLQVAEAIADTFLILQEGEVLLSGSYEQLLAQHHETSLERIYADLFWGEEGPLKRETIS